MKKFLKELKSLQPSVCESLQERILHDAKPVVSAKRSFSFGSFFIGTLGGTCVGLLLGMVLFSSGKSHEIVENPPVIEPEVQSQPPVYDIEPLELDRLIAQIDKRNRMWEKTTIPAYPTKIGVRPKLEPFLE